MEHVTATKLNRPRIGLDGAGNDLDQRRFARAVLADQGVHFSLQKIERYIPQRADARERLADRLGLQ